MKKPSKVILVIGIILVLASYLNSGAKKVSIYKSAGNTIDIALVYPKTGTDPERGQQFYKASILAQKMINENGGINGKQLQFTIMNSENSPNEAKAIAEDLITRKNVLCVIADSNNNCAEAAAPIYESAHMTQITPMASSEEFAAAGEYQFSASPPRSFNTKFDVQNIICGKMGYKSVGIIYINSNWAGAALKTFEKTAEENNLEIRVKEPIAKGQTKFNAIIQRVRQTNPDCLYILADYDETIKLLQLIRIEQWDVPVIVTGSYVTEQPENVIGTGLGTVISRRLSSLDAVMQQKENFIYEYRDSAKYSDMEFGMQVYDAVMMVAGAAEKCRDNLTRENFRSALLKIRSFSGLLGDASFDETGTAQRPFYVAKHTRGRWETITPWEDIKKQIQFR